MGAHAEQQVFDAIDPAKDVDGFHPHNVGLLVQGRPALVACTPLGCMELLEREGIPLRGRQAVVLGRSDIVGKPMALLLLQRDATVTVCHSKTVGLADLARTADILVAAIGRPAFVTSEFVKPGATVIDVGINTLTSKPIRTDLSRSEPQAVQFRRREACWSETFTRGRRRRRRSHTLPGGVGPPPWHGASQHRDRGRAPGPKGGAVIRRMG